MPAPGHFASHQIYAVNLFTDAYHLCWDLRTWKKNIPSNVKTTLTLGLWYCTPNPLEDLSGRDTCGESFRANLTQNSLLLLLPLLINCSRLVFFSPLPFVLFIYPRGCSISWSLSSCANSGLFRSFQYKFITIIYFLLSPSNSYTQFSTDWDFFTLFSFVFSQPNYIFILEPLFCLILHTLWYFQFILILEFFLYH